MYILEIPSYRELNAVVSGRLPHPKLKQPKLPEEPYKVDKVLLYHIRKFKQRLLQRQSDWLDEGN